MTSVLEAKRNVVRRQIVECRRCPLHEGCRAPVPFSGSPSSRLLIVGEAPGEQEDKECKPFVGRAGTLLNRLISETLKVARGDVMVANVVSCRPTDERGKNRAPKPDEIAACKSNLDAQLKLSQAGYVLLMGATALSSFRPGAKLKDWRGWPWQVGERIFYPTYHPAAALYDRTGDVREKIRGDLGNLAGLMTAPDGIAFFPDRCSGCRIHDIDNIDGAGLAWCGKCRPVVPFYQEVAR